MKTCCNVPKRGQSSSFYGKKKISQGKAAELLGISRHDLFDLMAKFEVPVIDMTEEELHEELTTEM